jgi:hypothetical protein
MKKETEGGTHDYAKLEQMRRNMLVSLLAKPSQIEYDVKSCTLWEEVTCAGFNPAVNQLEAVVSIKRATGYNGDLCSTGSTEFVRFFVDWGSGFIDAGVTSFQVYNISNTPPGPQHPLKYMVYLPLNVERHRKCCTTPVLPKVRAVLSWNVMPSLNPNDIPYYGNRIDAHIQIKPKNTIACLLKSPGLEHLDELLPLIDIEAPLPMLKPKPVPWNQLVETYRKAEVPDHRLVYDAIYPMIKAGKEKSYVSAQHDIASIHKLDIDLLKISELLLEKKSDTTYEQLVCVGLNTATDILGAVIHIKKPNGYSGTLCQTGSMEHVAFWADWDNNGSFDAYLGTASVGVHDISTIPADGLYYGVMLPANFSNRLKECKQPQVIRIRAVLSWSVLPSTTDPNDLNHWGNRLDVVVQIRPGMSGTELIGMLYDIGNIPISNISPVTYLAFPSTGVLDPTNCSQPAMDRPFGGYVRIGGRLYNTGIPESVHYQVQYSPRGAGSWLPVTNTVTFELMHPFPTDPLYPEEIKTVSAPDGWIPYQENPVATPPVLERTAHLASWSTGALQGEYDLRLAYTSDDPLDPMATIHYTDVVTILLDNTNFSDNPYPASAVDLAYTLDLVIDGGDCKVYSKGALINGHLRAVDTHFWKWGLELQPTTHTHGTQANPPCRSYQSLVDAGDQNFAWSLDTSALDKCGYTLTLWAYDRTIVDSNGAVCHWNKKAIGFSVT